MASIDVGNLIDRLDEDGWEAVLSKVRHHLDEPELEIPEGDDSASGTVATGLDEDVLDEFLDKLEPDDLGCDYFIPVEFDGKVDVGDFAVGSLPRLVEVLEEMRDDLAVEDSDADLEDPEADLEEGGEMELLQAELQNAWRALRQGALEAVDANLSLLIVR